MESAADASLEHAAAHLQALGLQPHQVERHLAGLAAAAKHRAAQRRARALAGVANEDSRHKWRLTLTPQQIAALLPILRSGPAPGQHWRWQSNQPADEAGWLWNALAHPSVGVPAATPDKPFAVANVLRQLGRAGLIRPAIRKVRDGSGVMRQYRFVRVCPSEPLPTVREKLPVKLPKPLVRERLPENFARRPPSVAVRCEIAAAPSLGAAAVVVGGP